MRLGVIDSGVGGLSVVPHLTASLLPITELVYVADTEWIPYGEKTPEQLRPRIAQLVDWLVTEHGVSAIALACNTATTVAMQPGGNAFDAMNWLRTAFAVPVVSPVFPTAEWMAYQLAHLHIPEQVVLWATPTTLASGLYQQSLLDFCQQMPHITTVSGLGLAARVEHNDLSARDPLVLQQAEAIAAAGSSMSLIMGCTHYPHAWRWLAPYMSGSITPVNPAEHLSAKLQAILGVADMQAEQPAFRAEHLRYSFYATGSAEAFATTARVLLPNLPWPHITTHPLTLPSVS